MCLGELGRVVATDPGAAIAVVRTGGREQRVSLLLRPDVGVGDDVVIHTGFVIDRLDMRERATAEQLRHEGMRR